MGWRTVLLLLAALTAAPLPAQVVLDGEDDLDFSRPESWAMAWATSLTLLTPLASPSDLPPGGVELGLETGWVPSLSEEERTVGFYGTKEEAINRTSVLARPRLTVGLPARFAATLGYIPPLEIDGVTPHLVTLALERLLYDGRRWRLGMRLHGQAGRVDGDITCDRDTVAAGEDRDRNPLGCLARSSDRLEVRTAGADATVALPLAGAPRLEPFLGVGINYFDLELAVDARYGNVIDRTRLVTSGSAWNATLGIAWLATERWVLSGEVFYTPLEVQRRFAAPRRTEELVNARAMLRYRLR